MSLRNFLIRQYSVSSAMEQPYGGGGGVQAVKEYSVINAVQYKACRFFLGVGKYSPNAAVNGDMGWRPAYIEQMKPTSCHWFRLNHMDHTVE